MWMVICFLKSQCKNKVTNVADSKCNLPSSMENEEGHVMSQDNHNRKFKRHLRDTAEKRPDDPLHVLDLNSRDIENPRSISIQSHQPLQCGKHKTEDELVRFLHSGLKADKSVREGISRCLSAPILIPCANKSYNGDIMKAEDSMCLTTTTYNPDVALYYIEDSTPPATVGVSFEPPCPTTTTVHSDLTIFSNKDPTHLEATELSCNMTGLLRLDTTSILPADTLCNLGLNLKTNAEIDQKSSEKPHENFNDETGQVRYLETHIELIGTMINEARLVGGVIKQDISSQEKGSRLSRFGKKSKSWTSFYDSENHLVQFQPETKLEPKTPTDVLNRSNIDKTEKAYEIYIKKEVQGECLNITEDVCKANQSRYISSHDQNQRKYNDHLSGCLDMADEQPGPSNASQRKKTKNEGQQAWLHTQMAQERLWKYHRNCCDEYQPCQTASNDLKKIKELEKAQLMQKPKQCPPSDQDLLEENPSPSLVLSTLSEDHALAKPAIISKITCGSLPNLSKYGNQEIGASYDAPSLKSPIQASVNVGANTARVAIASAGHLDLPHTCVVHVEHLKNMYPHNLNLAVIRDQPESPVKSKKALHTVSSSTLALPINGAPAVNVVGEKARVDDGLVSSLALQTINGQTEAIRSKNINKLSSSQLELPTTCEPSLGVAVHKTSFEHMNLYSPLIGLNKIDLVKSLSAIKILEGDNVTDNQSIKTEISSNKITLTDPRDYGNPSFENQALLVNLKTEMQKSQIIDGTDANGAFTNQVSNIAAITSSTSNPLVGMIPNHRELTTGKPGSTQMQESLKRTEVSKLSLDTHTQLTASVSYSNSIQDSEEVSDWPKIADLVKHSSTISLSSNFDILNPHLVPNFTHENLYGDSNTEVSVEKCERPEPMDTPCYIEDYNNMGAEGLSFKCVVLQQFNSETDDRKLSNGIEYENFYIQDGISQHYENPSEAKARPVILETQSIAKDQPDKNFQFLECAEKVQFEIENLEKTEGVCHNIDGYIINDNIVDHTSYDNITQTSNLDVEVSSRPEVQTRSEGQSEKTVCANKQTVNHKAHHLTKPFNNRLSEEHKGQEDLSKNLICPPDTQTQTREAEDPPSQTNMNDISNYSDLSTTVMANEAVDFKCYDDKLNERVNGNVGIIDINHDAENCEDILNKFQDILESDSTSASRIICTSAGNKAGDLLDAETPCDDLNTNYENDDSKGSKYKIKGNHGKQESVNVLRKASGDVPNCAMVHNSDATFDNEVNKVGAMDASLCNTEIPAEANQMLKTPQTYTKQTQRNQNFKTNRPLKTTNKTPPVNAEEKLNLKDYLSSRVYKRAFNSVFTFSGKTSNTEEDEVVKTPAVGEKPTFNDSAATRPSLGLSEWSTQNKPMDSAEYLTHLYARSPKQKTCLGSMNDIRVLANLHFCKIALPSEIGKQDMSTDVQEVNVDPKVGPADPENVYVPPSKEELRVDDELAVLHVIYTLKRSLELSGNSKMETE